MITPLRFAMVAILLGFAAQVHAQELKVVGENEQPKTVLEDIPSLGNATPEMWFYLQEMRRYDDPQASRRRRAELSAAARRARLNSQRWYGINNSRPTVNINPWTYTYSAHTSHASWDIRPRAAYNTTTVPVMGGPRQY